MAFVIFRIHIYMHTEYVYARCAQRHEHANKNQEKKKVKSEKFRRQGLRVGFV
jgi:hypothetical protein